MIFSPPWMEVGIALAKAIGVKWRYRKLKSGSVAFGRLRHIIAADRAAVPCGRWVKVVTTYPRWLLERRRRAGEPIPNLPRYRYEVRR